MSEKDEEGVDWCGPRNFWEEEVLCEFSGWVQIYLSSNQLTTVVVEKRPEDKEYEVFTNPDIPEEQVTLERGY